MGKPKARKAPAKKPAQKKGSAKKPRSSTPEPPTVRITKPVSPPAPPAPPPPQPPRDELAAPRDVSRLLRYGEKFGAQRIDTRWLQTVLPVTGGALALVDPAAPKTLRVLDRSTGNGQFRAMLSVARSDTGAEKLAALVIHVGRPPIAKWTVASFKNQKKPKPDALPTVASTGKLAVVDAAEGALGSVQVEPGDGEYTAYWAVDAADKPVALVVDFDAFTQKEWKAKPSS